LTALHQATEAFLTSTYREVQAISQVDDHRLHEAPGAISQQLAAAFRRKVSHEGWLGE
jgi:branched-subunit amino acid aminotransferase/4-amino-4-deoxychorismate lyase